MSNIKILKPFSNLCRTCLAEENLKPLYKNCSNSICLIEMLMSCTLVQFFENDGLPDQICEKCITEINQAYRFAIKCEIVDTILRNYKKQRENSYKINNLTTVIEHESNESYFINNKVQLNNSQNENIKFKKQKSELNLNEELSIYNSSEKLIETNESITKQVNQKTNEENQVLLIKKSNCNLDDIDNNKITSQVPNFNKNKQTKKYYCKICRIPFKTTDELKKHRLTLIHFDNLNAGRCLCLTCGKYFSSKYNLERHMLVHTGLRPYKCNFCEKSFNQQNTLREHIRIHSNEKAFKCTICDLSYKQKSQLQVHLRKHEIELLNNDKNLIDSSINNEKLQHKCDICNKRFISKLILNQHLKVHGEKNSLCNYCGKIFLNKYVLENHLRIHTGAKPFSCTYCGKNFRASSLLSRHKLVHTGIKKHICSVCNRGFTQKTHLLLHRRNHEGNRPFGCLICDEKFATNKNLKVHMKVHSRKITYLCPICNESYSDFISFNEHKFTH